MMCYESTQKYGLFHVYLFHYLNVSAPLLANLMCTNWHIQEIVMQMVKSSQNKSTWYNRWDPPHFTSRQSHINGGGWDPPHFTSSQSHHPKEVWVGGILHISHPVKVTSSGGILHILLNQVECTSAVKQN